MRCAPTASQHSRRERAVPTRAAADSAPFVPHALTPSTPLQSPQVVWSASASFRVRSHGAPAPSVQFRAYFRTPAPRGSSPLSSTQNCRSERYSEICSVSRQHSAGKRMLEDVSHSRACCQTHCSLRRSCQRRSAGRVGCPSDVLLTGQTLALLSGDHGEFVARRGLSLKGKTASVEIYALRAVVASSG